MNLSGFPAKRQASDLLIYQVYQLQAYFFGGKPLHLRILLGSQKNRLYLFALLLFYLFYLLTSIRKVPT